MSELEKLQAENEELRRQVESHRLRELETLKTQLEEARTLAAHYRAEAQRNADLGRQIHMTAQEELSKLRTKIESAEALQNANTRGSVRNVG